MLKFKRKEQKEDKRHPKLEIQDKKFRQSLLSQFDGLVTKDDIAHIMDEMGWSTLKSRVNNIPPKKRMRLFKYMSTHMDKLSPSTRVNFMRYLAEKKGVTFEVADKKK